MRTRPLEMGNKERIVPEKSNSKRRDETMTEAEQNEARKEKPGRRWDKGGRGKGPKGIRRRNEKK